MQQRVPWADTLPTIPHRLDAETVQRLREHGVECADEDDAARDYESEAGRDDTGPRIGLLLIAVSAVLVCVGVAHLLARFI